MPVTRTYRCDDCDFQFKKFHMNRDEPVPECPMCAEKARNVPGSFSIGTNKGKAIDIAQSMAEETFGLTDMHDNQRPGDIAAKAPTPMHTAEREAITRAIQEMAPALTQSQEAQAAAFWQHNSGANRPPAAMMAAATRGAATARQAGDDPIAQIHEAGRKGGARITADVMGSDRAGTPNVVSL